MFVVRKVIKGQAIADYLVDQPLNDPDFSEYLFLDEDVSAIEPEPSNVEPWRHGVGSFISIGLPIAPEMEWEQF